MADLSPDSGPHLASDQLAGLALDLDEATSAQAAHLTACAGCRTELGGLRRLVDLGRTTEAGQTTALGPPPHGLWDDVAAELGLSRPVHQEREEAPPPPAERFPRPRRRRAVLAVAAGVLAGVVATLGLVRILGSAPAPVVTDRPAEVVARAALKALPGEDGSGSAELLRTASDTELRVHLDAPADARAFHELWLINADGRRMYSLGVLPASGSATYHLPPALADGRSLGGYTTVDVSIEPYDGHAAHSRHSLVRGSLP